MTGNTEKRQLIKWSLGCLCLLLLFLAEMSTAGRTIAAVSSGNASVSVLEPLAFDSQALLDFGEVENKSGQPGTVTVTPQNQRQVSSNITVNLQFSRAELHVSGSPDLSYSFSIVGSMVVNVQQASGGPGGATSLQVVNLTAISANAGGGGSQGRTDADGNDIVYVGGTLMVPDSVQKGQYSGDVQITLSY